MTSTWLVTGAAGFIGSNLCEYLLSSGRPVVGLDNFFTGRRRNIERLQTAFGNNFRFIEGDIRDPGAVHNAAADCEAVVHLAAQVSVQRSIDDPAETNAINVDGFLSAYDAALNRGAKTFIYASSCAVYGDNPQLPLTEASETRPLSPYAASKLADEIYAGALGHLNPAISCVGLRFFNVYGPWQDPTGGYAAVIPRWISMLMEGQRPILFGDGSATRDFCFVKDICRLISIVGSGTVQPTRAVYNVATGNPTTLMELYGILADLVSSGGIPLPFDSPEQKAWRSGDILHSVGDAWSLQRDFGFSPEFTLKKGVREILADEFGLSE